MSGSQLSPEQQAMEKLWEEHVASEFQSKSQDGKMASERIYYDQASVLVQVGLLDPEKLPVAGVATARKVLDDQLPSNELMKRILRDEDL